MPSDAHEAEMQLVQDYRNLYWQANEYRIIATEDSLIEASRIERNMARIVSVLGYTPEA